MSKLGEITEGWKNNLTPESMLDPHILEVAKTRMAICQECEFISTKHKTIRPDVHCTDCGCPLSAKTKSMQSACPREKWLQESL